MKIPLRDIRPNPEQPRKNFDKDTLRELAESIKNIGLIQPIVVEEIKPGKFFIVDGERRFRASQMIPGVGSIEAIVKSDPIEGDQDRLLQAIVANVQREDLNPIEEGAAYYKLQNEFGMPTNRIALLTGKSIATVKKRIDLLALDEEIQALIIKENLSTDLRLLEALNKLPRENRLPVAKKIIESGISINQSIKMIDSISKKLMIDLEESAGDDPVLRYSQKKHKYNKRRWGLLQQLGRVPPWLTVLDAARSTCNSCSLSDVANEKVCGECPAVYFLSDLLRRTDEH